MKLIFASNNKKKLEEIKVLLPLSVELLSLADVNITEDIPETGDTFKANALIKAKYVLSKTGINCFADDSGLEVEALDMRPGVYSARYAGEPKNDEANIDLLLKELKGKENRKAQFHTVIALLINGGTYFFEGIVRGAITAERMGNNGFGYDPVFIADGDSKTFAELSLDDKNKISHRSIAVKQLVAFMEKMT
ncbi:MAG: non-canonical purine NTP diphosphatase [Bacteroidia bacterium]